MRGLTMAEVGLVSGGTDSCPAGEGGNNYGGVTDPGSLGRDLINVYEGLVEVTSYIIERVANAL